MMKSVRISSRTRSVSGYGSGTWSGGEPGGEGAPKAWSSCFTVSEEEERRVRWVGYLHGGKEGLGPTIFWEIELAFQTRSSGSRFHVRDFCYAVLQVGTCGDVKGSFRVLFGHLLHG